MGKTRILILFCALAVVAAAAIVGWVVGTRIESPAEAAARTAPPPPSPILVPVEERTLSTNVVTRGTARFGLPQSIAIAPSGLKANPGLITTLPLPNTQLKEGDVMLTASGRPLLILQGETPAYRDLVPGNSGHDVRQLEQGIKRLGFDPGPVDGTYDERTSAAVARWYESLGLEPFGPTPEQLAHIRTLEQESGSATKAKMAAAAAAAASTPAVESARAQADHAAQAAAAEVEAKIAARNKALVDLASVARSLESARATADHAIGVATTELEARTADANRMTEHMDSGVVVAIESAYAQAEYANRVAAAELAARIADRALVVLDPRQTRTARAAADAQVELARAAAGKIRLEGEVAVLAAERNASLAAGQLKSARAAVKAAQLQGETAIKAALEAQPVANRQLELAEEQIKLARAAVKSAQFQGEMAVQAALDAQQVAELDAKLTAERADRLAVDLETAKRKVGVQVPLDEIVFIPSLPVRVHEVNAVVGEACSGPVMSVTDNQIAIDSSLSLTAAPLVRAGMPVHIDEPTLGLKATGVVKRKANIPGTNPPGTAKVDGYHYYFEVGVVEAPTTLVGVSFRLTIPVESTKGKVTAVPISALALSADGTSRVQVENNGNLEYVVVEPGLRADGFVEVTPSDRTLSLGDLVVVGYEKSENVDLQ